MIPSNKEEDFTSKLTIKSFCPNSDEDASLQPVLPPTQWRKTSTPPLY